MFPDCSQPLVFIGGDFIRFAGHGYTITNPLAAPAQVALGLELDRWFPADSRFDKRVNVVSTLPKSIPVRRPLSRVLRWQNRGGQWLLVVYEWGRQYSNVDAQRVELWNKGYRRKRNYWTQVDEVFRAEKPADGDYSGEVITALPDIDKPGYLSVGVGRRTDMSPTVKDHYLITHDGFVLTHRGFSRYDIAKWPMIRNARESSIKIERLRSKIALESLNPSKLSDLEVIVWSHIGPPPIGVWKDGAPNRPSGKETIAVSQHAKTGQWLTVSKTARKASTTVYVDSFAKSSTRLKTWKKTIPRWPGANSIVVVRRIEADYKTGDLIALVAFGNGRDRHPVSDVPQLLIVGGGERLGVKMKGLSNFHDVGREYQVYIDDGLSVYLGYVMRGAKRLKVTKEQAEALGIARPWEKSKGRLQLPF